MPLTILVRKAPVPAAVTRLPASDEAAWRALHAIADRLRPELQRRLRDILAQAQRGLTRQTLESLLVSVSEPEIVTALADAWDLVVRAQIAVQVQPILQETFQAAALRALAGFTASLERLRFPTDQVTTRLTGDLMAPRAALWAEQHSGALVTQITQTTRDALGSAVRDALAHGKTVGQLTREVRGIIEQVPITTPMQTIPQSATQVRALTGLTPRQVGQVERYREGLIARGITGDKLVARVERKAGQLLRQRAELIARTESITAAAAGQQQLWEAAEREGLLDRGRARRAWTVTPDERLCSICRAIPGMNPDGVGLHEPFQTPIGPIMHPAAHPACVPGDTLVQASGILAASKRPYDGPMVILHTASGRQLSCTPNHPIATPDGWVAAGLLQCGQDVLCHQGHEGICPGHGMDDHHGPTRIGEIAEAVWQASGMRSMTVKVAAEDFDGDGIYSQVAVIGTNGLLGNGRDAGVTQPVVHLAFVSRHAAMAHDRLRGPEAFAWRFFRAADGLMSRTCLSGSLLGRHLRPFEGFGFVSSSWHDAVGTQAAPNDFAVDAEMLRQGIHRHPLMIRQDDVAYGNATTPGWNGGGTPVHARNPGLLQSLIERPGRDVIFLRDIRQRLASEVTCDNLVKVSIQHFIGHVYNLQTTTELYVAEGIITHNCRCAVALTFTRRPAPLTASSLPATD